VSDLQARLDAEVAWARRKLANLEERADLDHERDGRHWELVRVDGLSAQAAAAAIRGRLVAEGFTAEEISVLGVSAASIKPVARLRSKP
jgi:hypothetical protein